LAGAMVVSAQRQSDAQTFITDHGHAVIGGHADVGEVAQHDIGSDPDSYGADAAD